MDGISIAASLLGIGAAGCQVAIKLYTLATQMSTASDRISSISNDVSLTSGVLQQLGELMAQKSTGDGTSIISQSGLETTKTSAAMCQCIFEEIEQAARDASKQIRGRGNFIGGKIKLSKSEKAKWPFLQPSIEMLRTDLREAKGTLMLMLQVTSLAISMKMADIHQRASTNIVEQREIIGAILALQQRQHGNIDPTARKLSIDRTMNSTPRPFACKDPGREASWPDEETTLGATTSSDLSAPLPFRPHVLMAASFPDMPNSVLSQHRSVENHTKNLPIDKSLNESRSSLANSGFETPSNQSMRGGIASTPSESTLDEPDTNSKALDLFLMKPEIRDVADMIQLSWKIHRIRMQQAEIQKQVIKNQQEGNPALYEMFQELYAYEHKAIDDEIARAVSTTSLVSLKRTHADMWHRDILFKGVPGLQFTLERTTKQVSRPQQEFMEKSADPSELAQWSDLETPLKRQRSEEGQHGKSHVYPPVLTGNKKKCEHSATEPLHSSVALQNIREKKWLRRKPKSLMIKTTALRSPIPVKEQSPTSSTPSSPIWGLSSLKPNSITDETYSQVGPSTYSPETPQSPRPSSPMLSSMNDDTGTMPSYCPTSPTTMALGSQSPRATADEMSAPFIAYDYQRFTDLSARRTTYNAREPETTSQTYGSVERFSASRVSLQPRSLQSRPSSQQTCETMDEAGAETYNLRDRAEEYKYDPLLINHPAYTKRYGSAGGSGPRFGGGVKRSRDTDAARQPRARKLRIFREGLSDSIYRKDSDEMEEENSEDEDAEGEGEGESVLDGEEDGTTMERREPSIEELDEKGVVLSGNGKEAVGSDKEGVLDEEAEAEAEAEAKAEAGSGDRRPIHKKGKKLDIKDFMSTKMGNWADEQIDYDKTKMMHMPKHDEAEVDAESDKEEEEGEEEERSGMDAEQAERIVAELLGRYTTLFEPAPQGRMAAVG
ncbi:MAG: hypothetical protein Q9203_006134 [Teloschistes exilis]